MTHEIQVYTTHGPASSEDILRAKDTAAIHLGDDALEAYKAYLSDLK